MFVHFNFLKSKTCLSKYSQMLSKNHSCKMFYYSFELSDRIV